MGSGYELGKKSMETQYIYKKNSTTVQRAMNTLSNEAKWQQGVNNSNDIKRNPPYHFTTVPDAICFIYLMNCYPKKRKMRRK
ncbi:unnamed protein product [Rhizophagus irregularis]|nr:unnamed protein product [Rhizophagus irregularis]